MSPTDEGCGEGRAQDALWETDAAGHAGGGGGVMVLMVVCHLTFIEGSLGAGLL